MTSGCATISAIVALENARPADAANPSSKLLHFDAHLYLTDSKDTNPTETMAVLRYFNHSDISFHPDDVSLCFVVANVAKISSNHINLTSAGVEFEKYSMIGDIIQLIPEASSEYAKNPPVIHASGAVTMAVPEKSAFLLSPEQYVASSRGSSKPICPLRCTIPDSKRWGTNKPKPKAGTYISLTGYISGLSRKKTGEVEAFEVEIEKVCYLGKPLAGSGSSWADTSSQVETPANRKIKWSYNSMNSTPTPAPKKRRIQERDESISFEQIESIPIPSPPALEYVDSPVVEKGSN